MIIVIGSDYVKWPYKECGNKIYNNLWPSITPYSLILKFEVILNRALISIISAIFEVILNRALISIISAIMSDISFYAKSVSNALFLSNLRIHAYKK